MVKQYTVKVGSTNGKRYEKTQSTMSGAFRSALEESDLTEGEKAIAKEIYRKLHFSIANTSLLDTTMRLAHGGVNVEIRRYRI